MPCGGCKTSPLTSPDSLVYTFWSFVIKQRLSRIMKFMRRPDWQKLALLAQNASTPGLFPIFCASSLLSKIISFRTCSCYFHMCLAYWVYFWCGLPFLVLFFSLTPHVVISKDLKGLWAGLFSKVSFLLIIEQAILGISGCLKQYLRFSGFCSACIFFFLLLLF